MSERPNHQVKMSLSTLALVFFAILAQALGVVARASGDEPADGLARKPSEPPCPDTAETVRTSAALLGLMDVAKTGTTEVGGLWLSGNKAGGLAYLHWIAGQQSPGLLKLDRDGKVLFNLSVLANAAGVGSENAADQRAHIASFVRSDEGLRILAEVMNGAYRILLYVGPSAPTRAGDVGHFGILNLDNRFDSRISPLRHKGQKLDRERPPQGFDSLIALDPDVCWFNLENKRLMPMGQIVFHELAESHARLVLGLDYLPQGDKPGAHDVALDREFRLKQKRPAVVGPVGFNLRLVSRGDWLRLFAKLDIESRQAESRMRSSPQSSLQK